MLSNLKERLKDVSPERIVFVGVGNRMRGDDGIGPAIIDEIKEKVPNAIDTGFVPENFTSRIKRFQPLVIVLIDAVSFQSTPGSARILEISDVEERRVSAHNFSLDIVMNYLKEETGADVFMIGVQPKRITDEEELSSEATEAVKLIAREILQAI